MFVKWGVFVADRRRFLSRVLTRDTTTLPLATPASTERSPGAPLRVEGGAPGSAIPPPCRLPPQRAQNARRGPRCASRVGHPDSGTRICDTATLPLPPQRAPNARRG